jgi:SAM-dependent methyltransferase
MGRDRTWLVSRSRRSGVGGSEAPVLPESGVAPNVEPRVLLARFLLGEGVELGPGHHPFHLPFGGATVRYVDRWEPSENRELFPELGDEAPFPQPDLVANLDTDRLTSIPSESQDFVIASHVLEHLAEPLGQIEEIYRVLRDGGTALILLPDRRHTFDLHRQATSLDHLVGEYQQRVTTVNDDHLEEFMRNTAGWDPEWTTAERRAAMETHRKRSIHVHCWSESEFLPVLEHTMTDMGMRWELLDTLFVDEVPGSQEFGLVLRKTTLDVSTEQLVDHLLATWQAQRQRLTARNGPEEPAHGSENPETGRTPVQRVSSMAARIMRHARRRLRLHRLSAVEDGRLGVTRGLDPPA